MNKYREEYFSVINTNTGKKIADCGDELDALALVAFDPNNRTITRNKFLMGTVIDIDIPKALPTDEIVFVKEDDISEDISSDMKKLTQIKLPEGQGQPVVL